MGTGPSPAWTSIVEDQMVVSVGPYMFQTDCARRHQFVRQIAGKSFAAAENFERGLPFPASFDQELPGHRRSLHDGGSRTYEPAEQEIAVGRGLAAGDHKFRTDHKRQKEFQSCYVERERGHGEQSVVRLQAGLLAHREQQIDHGAMRNLDAFGLAGRT